ncbi:MAG TPA: DUF1080 domain-containing protein [Chitinophagaceae bacterium]|jgi:Domain of Unknown Function (DUF1080)|nr:DUF1080 domain-containing protein [Chitinophagaceae bacterium]
MKKVISLKSLPAISILTIFTLFYLTSCNSSNKTKTASALPKGGTLVDDKPVGKGWVNLIASLDGWNLEKPNWSFDNGILHGDYDGGKYHSYGYTKKNYKNFELNAVVRMTGREANSGVCIRIQPTNFDNAPGYQVDMGPGYWGCLWEERRSEMIQKYPKELADQLVKANDWNHYYIIANDHHIIAWLNGVKTIDTVHAAGFSEGAIGLQLCHGDKHTTVDVKTLYIRELK